MVIAIGYGAILVAFRISLSNDGVKCPKNKTFFLGEFFFFCRGSTIAIDGNNIEIRYRQIRIESVLYPKSFLLKRSNFCPATFIFNRIPVFLNQFRPFLNQFRRFRGAKSLRSKLRSNFLECVRPERCPGWAKLGKYSANRNFLSRSRRRAQRAKRAVPSGGVARRCAYSESRRKSNG